MSDRGVVHQDVQTAEIGDGLFDRALRRYLAGPSAYTVEALSRPTAREVAEAMVHGAADTVSGEVRGCLTVGQAPGLTEFRDVTVHRLAERFDTAVADGELSGVDTLLLARWIAAVCQGIANQARSGASRADLHAIAELALAGWPRAAAEATRAGMGHTAGAHEGHPGIT